MKIEDFFAKWLKGNQSAIDLIIAMHEVAEAWDDLTDQKEPYTIEQIHSGFFAALVTIPRNAFYQANFALLSPIVESAILDWHTANAMEARKGKDDLVTSYTLRSGMMMLTIMSARVIGGVDWAREVALEFRSSCEPFENYAAEHGAKK